MNANKTWAITERMMFGDFSLTKDYNENHDPKTGQFTEGSGASQAKEISFEEMMKHADNTISFDKIIYVSKKGYMPETGKKGDLGRLVDKYNIKEVVVNMYRDKAGSNDLKRLESLGFKPVAKTMGKQQEGSRIPPRDYYYMKRD